MNDLASTYLDQFANVRYPKRGKCANSCFADGSHRVGLVPVLSVLDGGLPGDSCVEICLECERVFKKRVFYPIRQPRMIGVKQ
jgi:hypothetical protein